MNQAPNDGELLRVLLSEVRELRPDDVEELQADGRDAAEVAGPVRALEASRQLLDLDPGLEAGRVDLVRLRREEDVDSRVGRDRRVALLVAGIRVEVCILVELGRVDEQAQDDQVALRARCLDQREMAAMERAHRRHEACPASP